ncbi:STAS domain-containing protein [Marinilabilia sp.]|jgi:MFS superfamily sulfate permease-like transporter
MKEDNFSVQVKKSDGILYVDFSGQLTINYIQKIKEAVSEQVDFSQDISVNVDNPDNLDITFLQLLQSLKTTAELNKKQLSISSTLPSELESLVSNAGFSDLLNSNPVNN